MHIDQIGETFRRTIKGRNFMTPSLVRYGKRGRMIFEVSKGKGIWSPMLYGLTIIELPNIKRHDLSTCFNDMAELEAYISNDFIDPNKENEPCSGSTPSECPSPTSKS